MLGRIGTDVINNNHHPDARRLLESWNTTMGNMTAASEGEQVRMELLAGLMGECLSLVTSLNAELKGLAK